MPSDKYERKRKKELDFDTTQEPKRKRDDDDEFGNQTHRRHRSRSPKKSSRQKKHRDTSPGDDGERAGEAGVESLSIEETNKLRAKLGLAPLELDDKANTEPVEKEDGSGEKVFTEHGIEIVHKAPKNWTEERHGKELKEKLDTRKKQRDVYTKVLKAKRTLGEESDEEKGADLAKWVEKSRKLEEEMRKAEQKAKLLDEMDEAFGIGGLIQAEQQKHRQKKAPKGRTAEEATSSGGLVVGHSLKEFGEGRETVLVLQDKDILEDGADEVLINPNMLENERHKLNVERRKKKDHYNPYEEEVDEFGQVKKQQMLSKYDEGIDGEKERDTFRLDESGQYDLDAETAELETRRRLMMLNKKFESLESTKYTLANEFHTEEEMIAFRRPKKKGGKSTRKRKALKADDLETEPTEETEEEKRIRETKLAARRAELSGGTENGAQFRDTMKESAGGDSAATKAEPADAPAGGEREDGELMEEERAQRNGAADDGKGGRKRKHRGEEADAAHAEGVQPPQEKNKWKSARANVNMDLLTALADKMKKEEQDEAGEEEEEEDEFPHIANGTAAQLPTIIEDEAEDELNAMLAKARRLKQTEQRMEADKMHAIKLEQYNNDGTSSDDEETTPAALAGGQSTSVVFDSTSEKYKSIGGSFGLFTTSKHQVKMETGIGFDEIEAVPKRSGTEQRKKAKEILRTATISSVGGSDNEMDIGTDFDGFGPIATGNGKSTVSESDEDEDEEEEESTTYTNILGEEKDVTKGVGAMLKLAGQKGYLESGERKLEEGKLKHLESKRFSKVEQGRYDIEDKTMRKLERMGTTGTGPTRPFPEKAEYEPKIEINYADQKGRILDPKEAFRVLSWKFHGKGPGKKQAEKHAAKVVKREKLKKMNSMDTPLGTLNKQLKKQEQLQAPYLVLSGRGDGGQPLQKE
ncbi:hypothetical protein niasHT_037936 [Heterodera trifolii]|uniref:U4/U6.U5 tri-snRNP-associated protein 1 n=1 Tax=Heterodera trifolii TaxID=157864 RepID=A0ABD2HSV6_9BILA